MSSLLGGRSKSNDDDMPELSWCGTDRYLCDVLEEMRQSVKSLNFGGLRGQIEEAQSLANRMESALGTKKTIKNLRDDRNKLKDARKKLEKEVKQLIKQKKKLSECIERTLGND